MAVAVSPASDAIDCLSRLSLGPPTHPEHLLSHRLEPFAMAMHLTSCIRIVGDDSKTCWRRDAATLRWRALWPLPKTLPAKSFRNSCSQGLEHPLYQSCIVISEVADFVIIVIVVAVCYCRPLARLVITPGAIQWWKCGKNATDCTW
jgi:hypothetical protein